MPFDLSSLQFPRSQLTQGVRMMSAGESSCPSSAGYSCRTVPVRRNPKKTRTQKHKQYTEYAPATFVLPPMLANDPSKPSCAILKGEFKKNPLFEKKYPPQSVRIKPSGRTSMCIPAYFRRALRGIIFHIRKEVGQ